MAVLGIDVGGSGIKGAIVDVDSGLLMTERFRLATPEGASPSDVAATVLELVKHFHWENVIGVGFPAVVRNGVTLSAANVDPAWIGTDAASLLKSVTGCPVYVVNDADAAGLAEMTFGAGRDYRHGVVLMLTLGTGIGSALFVNGHLVPNTELGHLPMGSKDAERRASDATRQRKNLSWQEWADRLQEYMSILERLFSPDLFIIGGGVSKQSEKFLPYLHLNTAITPAQLLNEAGIVGAALCAVQRD